jgi:Cap4 dsDNA endonuclease
MLESGVFFAPMSRTDGSWPRHKFMQTALCGTGELEDDFVVFFNDRLSSFSNQRTIEVFASHWHSALGESLTRRVSPILDHHRLKYELRRSMLRFFNVLDARLRSIMNSTPPPSFVDLLTADCPDPSGARSSNRFSFQSSFGTCQMLKLHEGGGNYCVLFDVHDDVVSLDDPVTPKAASFFQVKTKTSGNWTTHAITTGTKSSTGEPLPSFLGKLYKHRLKFQVAVDRLTFVSNARFRVEMADASDSKEKESIRVSDLSANEITIIQNALTAEHSLTTLTTLPTGLDSMYLETTPLSVTDHENHCIGVVATFLEKQGDGTIPPAPFHKTLKADIQRRTNREVRDNTFADMVKNRGLTRQQVQGMIDSAMSARKQDDLVVLVSNQLTKESFIPSRSRAMVENVRKYLAQRLDPTNRLLADAQKKIEAELRGISPAMFTSPTVITDTISHLSALNHKEWQLVRSNYSDGFLNAMFAVQIYEQELPPPDTQPQEENV